MTNKELRKSIEKLYRMLEKYPDNPKNFYEFMVYLRTLLRGNRRGDILPMTEIMSVIKHYKPSIYSELKKRANNNLMLEILTELSMDIQLADENLKKIMSD